MIDFPVPHPQTITANPVVLVYRGPWQPERIFLVLSAIQLDRSRGAVVFLWLCPNGITSRIRGFCQRLASEGAGLGRIILLDGRVGRLPFAAREVRRVAIQYPGPIVAIGFSALPFLRLIAGRRIVWFVQGVPDERLTHRDTRRARLAVYAAWKSLLVCPTPDCTVVVSNRMRDHMRAQGFKGQVMVVPNTVDVPVFCPGSDTPAPGLNLVYLGSGAPWQGVPQLARVWSALANLRPDARFVVLSRDPRCDTLAKSVPADRVTFTSTSGARDTAQRLWGCSLGFLIRHDSTANRVSWPLKLGEYLAAGVRVASSRIPWDVADFIVETNCGILLDMGATPESMAIAIDRYCQQIVGSDRLDTSISLRLDRSAWSQQLARSALLFR